MGIPQILVIFMMCFSVISHIVKHGQPKEDRYDAIVNFIGQAILFGILYAGGFWSQ